MGGSRRKLKRSRAKVRVGLPRKKPREFLPAFDLPEALAAAAAGGGAGWDAEGSVVKNYAAFGVVANPNFLGAHSRGTPGLVQSAPLQAPDIAAARAPVPEFEPIDPGSDLENDGEPPCTVSWCLLGSPGVELSYMSAKLLVRFACFA